MLKKSRVFGFCAGRNDTRLRASPRKRNQGRWRIFRQIVRGLIGIFCTFRETGHAKPWLPQAAPTVPEGFTVSVMPFSPSAQDCRLCRSPAVAISAGREWQLVLRWTDISKGHASIEVTSLPKGSSLVEDHPVLANLTGRL